MGPYQEFAVLMFLYADRACEDLKVHSRIRSIRLIALFFTESDSGEHTQDPDCSKGIGISDRTTSSLNRLTDQELICSGLLSQIRRGDGYLAGSYGVEQAFLDRHPDAYVLHDLASV